jgi:hypothetical protein
MKINLKTYFDRELRSSIIFAIIGIVIGYASFMINNSAIAFVLMVVVAVVAKSVLQGIMKIKEDFKWWFGNGMVVYIILWLVSWTIFYNVLLR